MKSILAFVLFLTAIHCSAQRQANVWYFGAGHGFDFSGGSPVYLANGMVGNFSNGYSIVWGSSTICDANGKLLFYTDGVNIWNAKHNVMPNGDSLKGNVGSASLIIPRPGSDNVFYVFTSDEKSNYTGIKPQTKGYRYSIVDMCLDSNRGDVIAGRKNILMKDSGAEALTAYKENTGNYWIVGRRGMSRDEFWAWHLTKTGLSGAVLSDMGQLRKNHAFTVVLELDMKFSPDGTKLAVRNSDTSRVITLYTFDTATGKVSSPCMLQIDTFFERVVTGIEFSPEGNILYTCSQSLTPLNMPALLCQFNLKAGSCTAIQASQKIIFSRISDSLIMSGLQLGPDGRIYVVVDIVKGRIGRINNPGVLGSGANFDSSWFRLPATAKTTVSVETFPNFVAGLKYHNRFGCGSLGITPLQQPLVRVYPNPVGALRTLVVQAEQLKYSAEFNVIDVMGRTVRRERLDSRKTNITLGDLPSGVYYYHICQYGGTVQSGKLVLE